MISLFFDQSACSKLMFCRALVDAFGTSKAKLMDSSSNLFFFNKKNKVSFVVLRGFYKMKRKLHGDLEIKEVSLLVLKNISLIC